MSEKTTHLYEQQTPLQELGEKDNSLEQVQVNKAEAEKQRVSQLEKARAEIEEEGKNTNEVKLDQLTDPEAEIDNSFKAPINNELKSISLKNELRHIRNQLKGTDKLGSKVIHQPVIRTISDLSSKSLTRPSGLLGGGLVALIGTSTYYFFCKYIGVRYNYLIFIILFVLGFIIGLSIEMLIWALKSSKKTAA